MCGGGGGVDFHYFMEKALPYLSDVLIHFRYNSGTVSGRPYHGKSHPKNSKAIFNIPKTSTSLFRKNGGFIRQTAGFNIIVALTGIPLREKGEVFYL